MATLEQQQKLAVIEQKRQELDRILQKIPFRVCDGCGKIEKGSVMEAEQDGEASSCFSPNNQLSGLKHQWEPATAKNTEGKTMYYSGHHYCLPDYISIMVSNEPNKTAEQINSFLMQCIKSNPFNKCIYCGKLTPKSIADQVTLRDCKGPYHKYRNLTHEWREATLTDLETEKIYSQLLGSELILREWMIYGLMDVEVISLSNAAGKS